MKVITLLCVSHAFRGVAALSVMLAKTAGCEYAQSAGTARAKLPGPGRARLAYHALVRAMPFVLL